MRVAIAIMLLVTLAAGCAMPSQTETAPSGTPQARATMPVGYEIVERREEDELSLKEASYPQTGIEAIDRDALALVDDAFVMEVGYEEMPDNQGRVIVDFTVERNDEIFSVVYKVYTYFSGAAHGSTRNIAMNYRMPEGKPLTQDDLFPDDDYVIRLSMLAEKKLRALEIDVPSNRDYLEPALWFFDGVSPDAKNFSNFVPAPSGLQLIYSDYDVAPYVVGEVRLTIPWEDIEDIMNAEWLSIVS